jgi:hypothetical protein
VVIAKSLERRGRVLPQRAVALPPSFATETYLSRAKQLEVLSTHGTGLTDARSGVVEKEQQCTITEARSRGDIRFSDQDSRLLRLEVARQRRTIPLYR